MDDYRFELQDDVVCKLMESTGSVIARHTALCTRVVQLMPVARWLIVLEDYYRFPLGQSNMYCIDHDLHMVWVAELPSADDTYVNQIFERGDVLQCGSWNGYMCELDPASGRIQRKVFTK